MKLIQKNLYLLKRFILTSVILILISFEPFSLQFVHALEPSIHRIDIHIILREDGSADITEVWNVTAASGTEWYLVQGNLGDIEIQDFSVSDETGAVYENEGEWDVDRSLEEKAGKCGIVDKGDGTYELCFGIGSYGDHIFTVSYHMTNFVKCFQDYCGFNQRLINDELTSNPQHISVTIEKPDTKFSSDDVQVWAFGFEGNISVQNGVVYAENTAALTSSNHVTIMCQFSRDMFQTANVVDDTFETMKEKALEGSNYDIDVSKLLKAFVIFIVVFGIMGFFLHRRAVASTPKTFEESRALAEKWNETPFYKNFSLLAVLIVALLLTPFIGIIGLLIDLFVLIYYFFASGKVTLNTYRCGTVYPVKQLKTDLQSSPYCKDIPFDSNLSVIYSAANMIGITSSIDHLVGAYCLRWLSDGKIQIQNIQDEKRNKKASPSSIIFLSEPQFENNLEKELYDMLFSASTGDHILREKDMKKWAKKHYKDFQNWETKVNENGKNILRKKGYLDVICQPTFFNLYIKKSQVFSQEGKIEMQKLSGLHHYLKDFAIAPEKNWAETSLWNDYLAISEIFCQSDSVAKAFTDLRPTFFSQEMGYPYDNCMSSLFVIHMISNAGKQGVSEATMSASGGGNASLGGGGGFSGGGSGGGSR